MDLKTGNIYSGFKLVEIREVPDISSEGFLFRHEKTGAKLLYIKNADDNKVFFVSFKTPPENDCGTAHIMEHSVLCGSKKYPLKDPFVELCKSSLYTYLNALTYSDKTLYPVASRNDKDFLNLTDVYLDAVFDPLIFKRPEIFKQEGWHFDMPSEDSPLTRTGVVYNEMKGALSDPEAVLFNAINRALFPSSIYRFESGGDPEDIPDLTYEGFCEFYKKHYHPKNSFFYLYGNLPLMENLNKIDGYISRFESDAYEIKILPQKKFTSPVYSEGSYSVSEGDNSGAYIALSFVVGKSTDPKLILAFNVLNHYLSATNSSILKKKVIESGICKDFEGWFDASTYDMTLSFIAKDADAARSAEFSDIIFKGLREIAEGGVDQELMTSCLNINEFKLKEENFGSMPKGLVYGMRLMRSFLHDSDPMESLMYIKNFEDIAKDIEKEGLLEKLSKELLDSNHRALTVIMPEEGKEAKLNKKEAEELEELKQSLSSEERKAIIKETISLKEYQDSPDLPEEYAKIPALMLSDIKKECDFLPIKLISAGSHKSLYVPGDNKGVIYVDLVFDLSGLPSGLIGYASLLAETLGRLGTENLSYDTLPAWLDRYTGGVTAFCEAFTDKEGNARPLFVVRGKALNKNLQKLFEAFLEIVFSSRFEDRESLLKILAEVKTEYSRELNNNGHIAAVLRALSSFDKASVWREAISGIDFYRLVCKLSKDEESFDNLGEKLKETAGYIFTRDNFMSAFTSDDGMTQETLKNLEAFSSVLNERHKNHSGVLALPHGKEAFTTGGKIVYNAAAESFLSAGFKYSGKMNVASSIISLEYLWNKVRVMGGAYGCGCKLTKGGNIYVYSYRDPRLLKTYNDFYGIEKFLADFKADDDTMRKYIIGAVNPLERIYDKETNLMLYFSRYISGITKEDVQKERDEVLSATAADIRALSEAFKPLSKESFVCTIGNSEKIFGEKGFFDRIEPLNS